MKKYSNDFGGSRQNRIKADEMSARFFVRYDFKLNSAARIFFYR